MVGLVNITYFVDSETKLTRPKLYSVLHTTEQPVYNIVAIFHVNTFYTYIDKLLWDKLCNFRCLRRLQHENLHVILDI